MSKLTPRETEVIRLIANGMTNKLIGVALGLSIHTVHFHVLNLIKKLDVSNRAEAVMAAVRAGVVTV